VGCRRDFFFYFGIFNYYFRNESDNFFFSNLVLLSHANPLARLSYASSPGATQEAGACPIATLVAMLPRHISHAS
jgi:hypothetical protein